MAKLQALLILGPTAFVLVFGLIKLIDIHPALGSVVCGLPVTAAILTIVGGRK